MMLAPAVTVKVLTRYQASLSGPVSSGSRFDARNSGYCSVALYPNDRNAGPLSSTRGNNQESLIENVLPGEYRVELQCRGGYPTAILLGRIDLLPNPRVTIVPGMVPEPIEITLKPGGSMLTAKLVVSPMPDMPTVLLVPSFGASQGPLLAPIALSRDSNGAALFGFLNLAPGDYVAYAFSHADEVEFRNPAFLQTLGGGTLVRIEENADKEITLKSVVK
jgi:hypothetical protein